jgi:hypothetical protein
MGINLRSAEKLTVGFFASECSLALVIGESGLVNILQIILPLGLSHGMALLINEVICPGPDNILRLPSPSMASNVLLGKGTVNQFSNIARFVSVLPSQTLSIMAGSRSTAVTLL